METSKKKNSMTRALAVILAVVLVFGGGTFAYLQSQSEEVTNTFNTNTVDVELEENTGEEYEIVQGTSQEKDPTVKATYTQDAYVFVEVTDTTEDLVTWYIANGWTELDLGTAAVDGVSVYYMLLETNYDAASGDWEEVTESTSDYYGWYTYTDSSNGVTYYYDVENDQYAAAISVLDGDKVYYSADITNEDMEKVSGEDLQLTFLASIIQADPFQNATGDENTDALAAYLALLGDSSTYATLGYAVMVNGVLYEEEDLETAIAAALASDGTATVEVVSDIEVSSTLLFTVNSGESASVVLDLNGNTISYDTTGTDGTSTYSSLIRVGEGVTLTITGDGVVDGTGMSDENVLIWARGGTVIIESGTFIAETNKEACVYASTPSGSTSVGTVEIYGGTFINTDTESYAYGSTLSPLTLNVWNGENGTGYNDQGVSSGEIIVYGGVFYGNDPANGDDALSTKAASDTQRAVTTFVADGYTSTAASTGCYVVTGADTTAVTLYANEEVTSLTLSAAIAVANTLDDDVDVTIVLAEGNYTVESTDVSSLDGLTIIGSTPDTTYLDVTALASTNKNSSVDDISISNVTFTSTNTSGTYSAFQFAGSGTFTNCVFDNSNGQSSSAARALTVTGDLTFVDCTFNAWVYALNLSADANLEATVTLQNCDVTGWTSFGGESLTLVVKDCTFHNSGITSQTVDGVEYSEYGVLRFYQNATVTGCTFDSDFEFIDIATSSKTITISDCTWTGHDSVTGLLYLADKDVSGVTWTVDGVEVTVSAVDWWN